jgi:hypothetical protein
MHVLVACPASGGFRGTHFRVVLIQQQRNLYSLATLVYSSTATTSTQDKATKTDKRSKKTLVIIKRCVSQLPFRQRCDVGGVGNM